MKPIFYHYHQKDVQSFRRLLDGASSSSAGAGGKAGSFGSSWNGERAERVDVNARDYFGRTVLHLAAAGAAGGPGARGKEGVEMEFVRAILGTPGVNVNLQDQESGWTPLHRALYQGSLAVARMLLARPEIDVNLKDHDGFTAFDLYNSTVEGTNPCADSAGSTELFSWGANRNYVLGQGDGNDRNLPERVQLRRPDAMRRRGGARFEPVGIREVAIAKLHTGVVTDEPRNNIHLCGFGSLGRLGRPIHTEFSLSPLPSFPHAVASVAVASDHTLLLTTSGDVYSFGSNKHAQLGYVPDAPTSTNAKFSAALEDEIQFAPKRVIGALKKEVVRGVRAARTYSAAWSEGGLFTWGSNVGQLGYDKIANPVQVQPRKVTGVTQPVIDVALSENAMCVLLESFEVYCFHQGGNGRINFSHQRFQAETSVYRPPISTKPTICKLTSSGFTFGALSTLGDVFTFTLPNQSEGGPGVGALSSVKPQRIWSLKKKFTAVRDVAIGSDGSAILCTESGHVFVRTPRANKGAAAADTGPSSWAASIGAGGGKSHKFVRVPYLQRITHVFANESGAFFAVRIDPPVHPIHVEGSTVQDDLADLQPHLRRLGQEKHQIEEDASDAGSEDEDEDAGADGRGGGWSQSIEKDIRVASRLCSAVERVGGARKEEVEMEEQEQSVPLEEELSQWALPAVGSDLVVHVAGLDVPVHTVFLAARSPVLAQLLSPTSTSMTPTALAGFTLTRPAHLPTPRLSFPPSQTLTALVLIHYLYSDHVLPVWDTRVGPRLAAAHPSLRLNFSLVRTELRALALALQLPALADALDSVVKRAARPTLQRDLLALLEDGKHADVVLELEDRQVKAHSAVLRARCPFFGAFFDDPEWTERRRGARGTDALRINMHETRWEVFRIVLEHVYADKGVELFDTQDKDTIDDYVNFVFEVLAVANELLLDKLKLVCSVVIRRHVTVLNASSIASNAAFYEADALCTSLFEYFAVQAETMLEGRYLDDMEPDLIARLTKYVRKRQERRLPIPRSGILTEMALAKHADWLAQLDIPKPILRRSARILSKSPALSPVDSKSNSSRPLGPGRRASKTPTPFALSPPPTPDFKPLAQTDDIFEMDEDAAPTSPPPASALPQASPMPSQRASPMQTPLGTSPGTTPTAGGGVWKSKTVMQLESAKVDLRTIMAEAAAPLPSRTSSQQGRPSPSLASSSSTAAATPSDVLFPAKLSQRDRRKLQQAGSPTAPEPGPSSRPAGSPWKLPEMRKPTVSSTTSPSPGLQATAAAFVPGQPIATPPRPSPVRAGSSAVSSSPSAGSPLLGARRPSATPPVHRQPSSSAVGAPVITPVRASQNSDQRRRTSTADNAWAQASLIAPSEPSPTTPTASFAAIQLQQQDYAERATVKKKSLAQIQEEERAAQAAKRDEEDFLAWWAAEEERVRAESAAATAGHAAGGQGKKKGGGGGGGEGGGKGKKGKDKDKEGEASGSGAGVGKGAGRARGSGSGGRGGRKSGGGGGGQGRGGSAPPVAPSPPTGPRAQMVGGGRGGA